MEKLKFKTNIKCGGCIATVQPYLDELTGIQSWDVDIQDTDKILTVEVDSADRTLSIISTLRSAGFTAEKY